MAQKVLTAIDGVRITVAATASAKNKPKPVKFEQNFPELKEIYPELFRPVVQDRNEWRARYEADRKAIGGRDGDNTEN